MEEIKYSLYIHINKSDDNKAYVGISEYWFYMYYKREVPMLNDIDISFGIEYDKKSPTMSTLGMV